MDSYEEMIIPEVPKVLPNEQLFIYVPTASNENLGVAKFDNEHFSVDPDGTVHSMSIVTAGNITISRSQWTDETPTIAQFSIPLIEKGQGLIIMPANDPTKQAAVKARLSMYPNPFPSVGEHVVEFIRAKADDTPTIDMTFNYLVFKIQSADIAPSIALIGVDAYGEGGGTASGVDEEAVKALIDKEVPEWAKQPTKPTYTADEVNARPNTWMPTAEDVGARPNTWTPTASDVGADASGTAASKVTEHNTATDTHNDIRLLIQGLDARLTALADSDDTTLDQLSELVAYIKANRGLIESITTDKVNVADIINNLTTNTTNKPLSAAQGVALKALIDALTTTVDGKTTPEQVAAQINTALTPYIKKEDAANTYQPIGDYLTPATGDQRYEPIKQKLEEMGSEEELYERGDTAKQYIVGGYVYEYAPDEVWTQYTEFNTGLVNLSPPVNTSVKEDNSDLVYKSGVLTSGLIPFSRDWDASGESIRALSKVVINTKDSSKIGELKPTSMGLVTTAIGTFHYKTDGAYIGFTKASAFSSLRNSSGAAYSDSDNIPLSAELLLKDRNISGMSSWSSVGYVRVVIGIGADMTDTEVANLAKNITITVPETYKETRTGKWVNTGEKAYDDAAVREVAEAVAALDTRVTAAEGAIAQINEALGGGVTTVANYRAIAFIGDSITYGSGSSNYGTLQAGWVGEVMTRCGYDEATSVNLGVSGAGFVQIAPAPSSVTIVDIVNTQSFAAFDDIIVSAGINDWKNTTIALADFWTNLKAVFIKLRADNKYARIYYQLPYNCKISSWTGSTYDTHYALEYKEGGSGDYCLQYTLATFRQMIVDKINTDEDLKTLGIRVIDYMPLTRNNIDQITGDGLHPNAIGYKIIGKTIAQILNMS